MNHCKLFLLIFLIIFYETAKSQSITIYAGLDMHVHIENESSPKRYLEKFSLNKEDMAFRAARYAKRTLMVGFIRAPKLK